MKYVIFFLAVFFVQNSFAQSDFKGTLLNADKQPIASANIILLSLPDSTLVKGTISNEKGVFEIPNISNSKNVALKIIHLEYKTKIISPSASNLGNIVLEKSVNELGEVVVSSSKPIMKQQGTVISTNVAQSRLKNLPQLSMLISFLPGVSQSGLGNVEVFGKKNPVYYINNRRVRETIDLFKISPKEVESIEIETQPGAEFENNVGAVIRIKLKKKGEGLGGFVAVETHLKRGFTGHTLASLNYNIGKTDFFLIAQPRYVEELYPQKNQELSVNTKTQNWQVNVENKQKQYTKTLTSKVGFTHDFNKEHSIGASFASTLQPYTHRTNEQNTETFQNKISKAKGQNLYNEQSNNIHFSTNAYYEGKLSPNLKLQVDLNHVGQIYNTDNKILQKDLLVSSQTNVSTHSYDKSNVFSLRNVFTQNIKKSTLNYGFDVSKLLRSEDYKDQLTTSYIDNKEDKVAVFANYSFSLAKMNIKSGLRYEYTNFEYFENDVKNNTKSRVYGNWLPNVSVAFPWDKTQWAISYIKRINRPAFHQLSDYSSFLYPFMYNRGNPNLIPSLTDEFSLLTSYKNYSFSAEYSFIKNAIYEDYALSALNPNVIEKTIRNFGDFQGLKLLFSAQHNIGIWSHKTQFALVKQFGEGVFIENDPIFRVEMDNQFLFSEKWMGICNIKYSSKGSNANTYFYKENTGVSVFFIRTFPKYATQLYMGVFDVFNSYKDYTEIRNPFILNRSFITNNNSREFAVALIYHIKPTQSKYKGQELNENRL